MSAIHDKQVSQEKKDIVASLKEELTSAKGAVLTSYRGLTVAQDTQLRRALREAGVSYHVVKNTLTTIAAKEAGMDGLVEHLAGTTALASALASLPSREVLIAKLLGSMQAPISGTVGVLSGVIRNAVYVLDAIRQQKESA